MGIRRLNEHLCLETARLLGLPAARSQVASFGDERVIVVERYDRRRMTDGQLHRVHQEDMCQALGLPPTAKYQNDGGPTPEHIARLLHEEIRPATVAQESVSSFVDALALNWILGGTDAHAKNYSVLLSDRRVRLAPLYDVGSALPYDDLHRPELRMAMKIGGEYRLARIGSRHWQRLANELGIDADTVASRVHELAVRVPDELAVAASADAVQALGTSLPDRLVDAVSAWADRCRQALA